LNGLSPYFFDRSLTIATDVAPAVLTREGLHHIRNAAQMTADPDDVLQFLSFAAPLVQRSSGEFFQDLWGSGAGLCGCYERRPASTGLHMML
jgi:hypothetical protein